MILTFTGPDARLIGRFANRLCEVLRPDGQWHTAHSMAEVVRLPDTDVRLRCDARVLVEDITRENIPLRVPLADTLDSRMATMGQTDERCEPLQLIRSKLA